MSTQPLETLYTGRLSQAQLSSRLAAPRAQAPFAILESLIDLDFPAANESIDLEMWPKGRIFGPEYELRWEEDTGAFMVWTTGLATQPDQELEEVVLDAVGGLEIADTQIYLWGPGNASLARPPVYRSLPAGKGYPVLLCREFRRSDGRLALYRFTGMQWKEEQ